MRVRNKMGGEKMEWVEYLRYGRMTHECSLYQKELSNYSRVRNSLLLTCHLFECLHVIYLSAYVASS